MIKLKSSKAKNKTGTMAYKILQAHNHSGDMENLKLKFDSLASHDITYVGVIQTAKASGLSQFPLPYVLTNCHNSLCAVGGTINADDHKFGLSAAKKYGGDFVPAHIAVIHQYMREVMASCGKMILGTDSHTRYGPLGTMGIGEGGGELVKQLLNRTYDINYPEVIAVKLENAPRKGVGPQDVALALIREVFAKDFAKNKVLEFIGDGIANLSMDYRIGIDVMTTEAACLSSIWQTDDKTRDYLNQHGRSNDFCELKPDESAEYDGIIEIDLSQIKPMIAMPFHPSNAFTIEEYLEKNPRLEIEQAVVGGCAGGTFENIAICRDIIGDKPIDSHLNFSIYPASQPIFYELNEKGIINQLMNAGTVIRTAFCGPCFGAGDVPANNTISIRHVTRNFPNREGSRPVDGQSASVALMDARSIAATVKNGGLLTAATEIVESSYAYNYNPDIYKARVYKGHKNPKPNHELVFGPNIKEWPSFEELKDNMLMRVCSLIHDEVTTTDELIPSGEASSYRSNPIKLAEFTLSRKDPEYRDRAKALLQIKDFPLDIDPKTTTIGSVVVSNKPGDGSAREQAASCQRVLGGVANIALSYATKRYKSNLINWGLAPFTIDNIQDIKIDDYIYVEGIKDAIINKKLEIDAVLISPNSKQEIKLRLEDLQDEEREILVKGCLINYYKEP